MSRLTALLGNLSRSYNRDPLAIPALNIACAIGAQFRVATGYLDATPANTSVAALHVSLRGATLGSLAAAITAVSGYTATATVSSAVAAYTLVEGQYNGTGGMTVAIPYFTSPTHQTLGPVGAVLDDLDTDLQEAMRMTDLRHASGVWVDRWGSLYGTPRNGGEADLFYGRRINFSVVNPKCNGNAIARILQQALGIAGASVADTGPGAFTVTLTLSDTQSGYDSVSITSFINTYKALGTQGTFVTQTQGIESYQTTVTPVDTLIDSVNGSNIYIWGGSQFGQHGIG